MIDATCPKCGRRIGWSGKMVDRPKCRRCGHRPPESELAAADLEMEEFEKRLAALDVPQLRQHRVDAGLTLRQASRLLGISPTELSAYEQGTAEPSAATARQMAEVYGVGVPPEPPSPDSACQPPPTPLH
jgi:DNA-binding XRE family transcriptional regulator